MKISSPQYWFKYPISTLYKKMTDNQINGVSSMKRHNIRVWLWLTSFSLFHQLRLSNTGFLSGIMHLKRWGRVILSTWLWLQRRQRLGREHRLLKSLTSSAQLSVVRYDEQRFSQGFFLWQIKRVLCYKCICVNPIVYVFPYELCFYCSAHLNISGKKCIYVAVICK